MKNYGISSIGKNVSELESHIENLKVKGYTVVSSALEENLVSKLRLALDTCYDFQESEFDYEHLKRINELDILRCPLAYDAIFLELITQNRILEIVKEMIGKEVQLHLQNGIINRPNKEHHQSSWHRDLPYQEYVISKPLGVSVLYCIDEFSQETGSTILLPYSHKESKMPSEKYVEENQVQIKANSGDAIIFDCMVFHKAGYNSSSIIRRAINNVFVAPLLKQQIDLPNFLKGKYKDDPNLNALLGYKFEVTNSVTEYRKKRLE